MEVNCGDAMRWRLLAEEGGDGPGARAAHSATIVEIPSTTPAEGQKGMLVVAGHGSQLRRDSWYWNLRDSDEDEDETGEAWQQIEAENCAVPNGAACAISEVDDAQFGCNSAYRPLLEGSILERPSPIDSSRSPSPSSFLRLSFFYGTASTSESNVGGKSGAFYEWDTYPWQT